MNDDFEPYLIPKHLDAPPMFLIWEADTAGVFGISLMMGFMFEQLFISILLGLWLARIYSRLKHDGGRGVFIHFAYWYTPSRLWVKSRIESHIKHLLG